MEIQARATAQLDTLARSDRARYKPMADDCRKRLVLYKAGRTCVDERDQ